MSSFSIRAAQTPELSQLPVRENSKLRRLAKDHEGHRLQVLPLVVHRLCVLLRIMQWKSSKDSAFIVGSCCRPATLIRMLDKSIWNPTRAS